MKINEVTEGLAGDFARSLGAAAANKLGATNAANAMLSGTGKSGALPTGFAPVPSTPIPGIQDKVATMSNTVTTGRLVNAIAGYAKKNSGKFPLEQIGRLLNDKFPVYWKSEKNQSGVIQAVANELKKVGVNTTNAPAAPAWKMGDPIPQPGGSVITPADGKLYTQAAAQM